MCRYALQATQKVDSQRRTTLKFIKSNILSLNTERCLKVKGCFNWKNTWIIWQPYECPCRMHVWGGGQGVGFSPLPLPLPPPSHPLVTLRPSRSAARSARKILLFSLPLLFSLLSLLLPPLLPLPLLPPPTHLLPPPAPHLPSTAPHLPPPSYPVRPLMFSSYTTKILNNP